MKQEIIDEIMCSDRVYIRVAINDSGTGKWVDVRVWQEFPKSKGKLVPTAKGVGVGPDNIDDLISALLLAKSKLSGSDAC